MKNTLARIGLGAMTAISLAIFLPAIASADTVGPITFESPIYNVGSINGQDGWSATGPYDQAVVSSPVISGSQSFRISDAVTSSSFGDWVFAKPLINAVGETAATAGAFSVGTKQAHFETEFDIKSTQSTQQPGLHISVSPDRGDGSRMSYLRFEDGASGINVFFDDVTSTGSAGTDNFNEVQVGTNLDRTISHHIKLTLDTIDGPSNDVVKVYIDGNLVHTGTSWEDYYRFDSEASAEQTPRVVKTVIIQARGTATPADAGKGFLIDNLSLSSGPIPSSTVKVTIDKFIDGAQATAATAQSLSFPMSAAWNAANIGAGTGGFALSTTGFNSANPYEAVTSDMTTGANYTTSELMSGANVGANCAAGKPYMLAGYKSGDTLAAAMSSTLSATAPNFTGLTSDKFVLVINKPCLAAPVNVSPADGATLTTATWLKADWTDVTSPIPGAVTYIYESSNSNATNTDGSFVTPVYVSGPLSISEIPTTGTPAGTYYWHAKAVDADGNVSPWGTPTKTIVDNTPPPALLKVHIEKYLDNALATAATANNYLFPMTATWQTANLNAGATTSGNYFLGNNHGGAPELYGADTAPMQSPANYSTFEVTDANSQVLPTASDCVAGKYRLQGYKTSGVSFADAATQATTTDASFLGLSSDQYVLVYNETCATTGSLTITKDTIGGNATFNFSGDNGIGNFSLTTVANTASKTFTNLAPGTYHITEAAMTGWTAIDADNCATVQVTAGSEASCTFTNATAVPKLGEIRGTKFEDRDGDGKISDDSNHKLSGWTMYLDLNNDSIHQPAEPTATTDSHGNYRFMNVAAGTYHVREIGQTGWMQTFPSSGSYTVVLAAGKISKHNDFGNFKLGTISGMKFHDLNANGKKNAGEPGIANWTIKLTKPNGSSVTTTTDANGNYSFTDLGPGVYKVREVQQSGWKQTTENPGSIRINSGTNSTKNNFGNKQPGDGKHDNGNDNDNGHRND